MTISFQTLTVGVAVTVAHVAAIMAIKPATAEVSKYFETMEVGGFVEDVLVKHAPETTPERIEELPEILAGAEDESGMVGAAEAEAAPAEAAKEKTPIEVPESTVEFAESFIDLEKEMGSMKAVTDVRVFSGRIEQPTVRRRTEVEAAEETVEKSAEMQPDTTPIVAEPAAEKPAGAGPFKLREIRPVSRS